MKALLSSLFILISTTYVFAQNTGVNTIPEYTLDVRSFSNDEASQLNISNFDKSRYLRFFSGSNVYPDPSMTWKPGKNLLFATYDDLSFDFTEYMRIDSVGDIGIGVFNPEARLDIKGGDWNLNAGNPGDLRIGDAINNLRIGVATGGGGAGVTRVFSSNNLLLGVDNTSIITMSSEGQVGIGTENPTAKTHIVGSPVNEAILKINNVYQGQTDLTAVETYCFPSDGYGVGANFRGGHRGLRGLSDGKSSQRTSIGVVGAGYGNSNQGTRVGLWGDAYGGNVNWAGYFDNGNVYVRNELRIGSGAIDGAAGYKLAIDGKVIAEEMRINLQEDWPDYVFEEDYELISLSQLEKTINEIGHLPGVPSAHVVEEEGILLGDMQRILLEKVEELTLHVIALQKQIDQLKLNR